MFRVLYIFRVEEGVSNKQLDEEGRKALVHELKDGRLRQGWGINGSPTEQAWKRLYLGKMDRELPEGRKRLGI